MDLRDILLRKLDSVLNPKLEIRMIISFLTLGIILVGVPSVSAVSAFFSVTHGETTFTAEISNGPDITFIVLGVVCLAVAFYLFECKRKRDELQNLVDVPLTEQKDRKTLLTILESVNTNIVDASIDRGRLLQFYTPVIHYYYGIEGLAKSSSFALYNSEPKRLFEDLSHAFEAFISHGAHFRETPNPDLHRFVKPHELGNWKEYEEYQNSFLADVEEFSTKFCAFIDYVKRVYPDIDLEITNRTASEDYARYNA